QSASLLARYVPPHYRLAEILQLARAELMLAKAALVLAMMSVSSAPVFWMVMVMNVLVTVTKTFAACSPLASWLHQAPKTLHETCSTLSQKYAENLMRQTPQRQ